VRRALEWLGGLTLGLVITAIGWLVFSLAWDAYNVEEQLLTHAVYGTATIVAKETRPVKRGVKTGQPMIRSDFFVAYSFRIDETSYTGEAQVSQGFFHGVEIGGLTPVRYLAGRPQVSEIEFGHSIARNYGALFFGGFFLLAGTCLTGLVLVSPLAQLFGLRSSRPTPP
jgi:hypothetical protein